MSIELGSMVLKGYMCLIIIHIKKLYTFVCHFLYLCFDNKQVTIVTVTIVTIY